MSRALTASYQNHIHFWLEAGAAHTVNSVEFVGGNNKLVFTEWLPRFRCALHTDPSSPTQVINLILTIRFQRNDANCELISQKLGERSVRIFIKRWDGKDSTRRRIGRSVRSDSPQNENKVNLILFVRVCEMCLRVRFLRLGGNKFWRSSTNTRASVRRDATWHWPCVRGDWL